MPAVLRILLAGGALVGACCLSADARGSSPGRSASARTSADRPIPNPVIYTNPFPLGIDFCPAWCRSRRTWPMMPGVGVAIYHGYPFGLTYSQLQPGTMVRVPAAAWWRTRYGTTPLVEIERRVDPSQAHLPHQASPPRPPPPVAPPVDEGAEALRAGEWDRAIAVYTRRDAEQRDLESRAITAPPPDRAALRLLALALAGAGRMDEAERMLGRALTEDPSLVSRPVPPGEVFGSREASRRLVVRAVKHAHAAGSPGAWELAAVLMEADGRPEAAKRVRRRAEEMACPPSARPTASPHRPARDPTFRMPPVETRGEPSVP